MFSSSEFDDMLARLRGVEELLKSLEHDSKSRDGDGTGLQARLAQGFAAVKARLRALFVTAEAQRDAIARLQKGDREILDKVTSLTKVVRVQAAEIERLRQDLVALREEKADAPPPPAAKRWLPWTKRPS
jgi:hypothetical protein